MSDDAEDGYQRPRADRGRRARMGCLPVLLGIVLALVAIAAVGDRIAARYATGELRAKLVSELSNQDIHYQSLDVTIGGFPFLAQVAEGSYDEITIEMTDVKLPPGTGRGASLPSLHVVATDVDADTKEVLEGTAKVNARQVAGTAVVSFATLQSLVDFSAYGLTDVVFTEDGGGMRATGRTTVSGFGVPLSATADVSVSDGKFQVKLRDVTAVSLPAPSLVTDALTRLAQQSLTAQLPQLPFGLTLEQVSVQPAGLAITATGRDVPLVG